MGGTDSIAAHIFQQFQAAFNSPDINNCSQAPHVMVFANPSDFHGFPIQRKAFYRVETERTDPRDRFIYVEKTFFS